MRSPAWLFPFTLVISVGLHVGLVWWTAGEATMARVTVEPGRTSIQLSPSPAARPVKATPTPLDFPEVELPTADPLADREPLTDPVAIKEPERLPIAPPTPPPQNFPPRPSPVGPPAPFLPEADLPQSDLPAPLEEGPKLADPVPDSTPSSRPDLEPLPLPEPDRREPPVPSIEPQLSEFLTPSELPPPEVTEPEPLAMRESKADSPRTPDHLDRKPVPPPRALVRDTMPEVETDVSPFLSQPSPASVADRGALNAPPRIKPGNRPPIYPEGPRRLGIQGRVMLVATISAEGTVQRLQIHESSGNDELDRAALDAVRDWKFTPKLRSGRPIASRARVPINFTLDIAAAPLP